MSNTGRVPANKYDAYRELLDIADHLEDPKFNRTMHKEDIAKLWELSAKYRASADELRVEVDDGPRTGLWRTLSHFDAYEMNKAGVIRNAATKLIVKPDNRGDVELLDDNGVRAYCSQPLILADTWKED